MTADELPDHSHCPLGCEHPQPLKDEATGEEWCMRCWCKYGLRTLMVPCAPPYCEEQAND